VYSNELKIKPILPLIHLDFIRIQTTKWPARTQNVKPESARDPKMRTLDPGVSVVGPKSQLIHPKMQKIMEAKIR